MMQVIEEGERRLVLRQRQRGMAGVLALFTVLSAFFLVNTAYQGAVRFALMNGYQRIGLFLWLALALSFVVIGITASFSLWQGITCAFDKDAERVTLRRPGALRMREQTHRIYSVSHVELRYNEDIRVYGFALVLRSGERIVLATVQPFDADAMRHIVQRVKGFLRKV